MGQAQLGPSVAEGSYFCRQVPDHIHQAPVLTRHTLAYKQAAVSSLIGTQHKTYRLHRRAGVQGRCCFVVAAPSRQHAVSAKLHTGWPGGRQVLSAEGLPACICRARKDVKGCDCCVLASQCWGSLGAQPAADMLLFVFTPMLLQEQLLAHCFCQQQGST